VAGQLRRFADVNIVNFLNINLLGDIKVDLLKKAREYHSSGLFGARRCAVPRTVRGIGWLYCCFCTNLNADNNRNGDIRTDLYRYTVRNTDEHLYADRHTHFNQHPNVNVYPIAGCIAHRNSARLLRSWIVCLPCLCSFNWSNSVCALARRARNPASEAWACWYERTIKRLSLQGIVSPSTSAWSLTLCSYPSAMLSS